MEERRRRYGFLSEQEQTLDGAHPRAAACSRETNYKWNEWRGAPMNAGRVVEKKIQEVSLKNNPFESMAASDIIHHTYDDVGNLPSFTKSHGYSLESMITCHTFSQNAPKLQRNASIWDRNTEEHFIPSLVWHKTFSHLCYLLWLSVRLHDSDVRKTETFLKTLITHVWCRLDTRKFSFHSRSSTTSLIEFSPPTACPPRSHPNVPSERASSA